MKPELKPSSSQRSTRGSPPASTSSTSTPSLVRTPLQQGHRLPPRPTDLEASQLVSQWTPEILRYGLTSSTLHRGHSSNGTTSQNSTEVSSQNNQGQRQNQHQLHARRQGPPEKRPSEGRFQRGLEPALKRGRLDLSPGVLILDRFSQIPSPGVEPPLTSPIFFSSHSRPMTTRPPSYTASEASATIMGRLQENAEKVTKQWLPKGTLGSAGSARSSSNSSMRFDLSPGASNMPPQLKAVNDIGMLELLEQDERPTLVIDISNPANMSSPHFDFLFQNASLRACQPVVDLLHPPVLDSSISSDFFRFKSWVMSFALKKAERGETAGPDIGLPSLSYGGISWTCSTLRKRYRVVSGNSTATAITPTSPMPVSSLSATVAERPRGPTPQRDPNTPRERASSDADYFGIAVVELQRRAHSEPRDMADTELRTPLAPEAGSAFDDSMPCFDWTRIAVGPNLPPHIAFARSVNWSSTPLGPVENWPDDLRVMSNMIMGSPHPAALYWGTEHVALYNETYIDLAGKKHPRLMGMKYEHAWAELWELIEPVFENAWYSGQATMKHDDRLFITRNGFLEETFFNWSIIPLVGGDGSVVALYNPAFENTSRKIAERRMLTLREIGEKTSQAQSVKNFWDLVGKGLEYNEWDVPFALIYSVCEDSESDMSSMQSGSIANPPQIVLEGSVGVPADHLAAVHTMDLRTCEDGFAPYMRESMSTSGKPVVLTKESGTLPASLVAGLEARGFADPCRTAVIFPVHPTTAGDAVVGFIVMGINPRRPYDEEYQLFIHLLSRQLATSLASVVLFEDEIKRGQRAARLAAMDRQELSTQLLLRTQEAVESEYKFTRMAEFSPVGMFIANQLGSINYCNDMWWQLSRHPRGLNTTDSWMDSVFDDDRPALEEAWTKLVRGKIAITHEFRFKHLVDIDGAPAAMWVLLSAFPERDEFHDLKRIFGCITDISQQKWAEAFQKQRRDEAVELKRQQENFIDITSHEMRNPLSAILQCSDEITSSISAYSQGEGAPSSMPPKLGSLLRGCLEASNTISLCASHQKRIVDDILTLSKLDSQLLLVTPVDVQPVVVVRDVMKMFEAELHSHGIRGEFCIDASYQDLGINWVKLDPSRLRQVLINLMTNAIKFTQSREEKSIVVSLAASLEGQNFDPGLSYFPSRSQERDRLTDAEGWGDGQKVKLHINVTDTGPGIDEHEKRMLFQRFSQTSPRTHVQYGGSGLGLFISKILSELQGGQIGVHSEKGVGSIFAFYIRARTVPQSQLSPSTGPAQWNPFDPTSQENRKPIIAYTTSSSKPCTPATLPEQPAHIAPTPAAYALEETDEPAPLEILIVEDNLVNQKVLQRQLRNAGNNTHVANHGGEALEALKRSRIWNPNHPESSETSDKEKINISIILMDLEMPVMDGLTCARKIRELEARGTLVRHVPIIAVTAYARPEQVENAKAAGMDDVITKPFRLPELIPKIEELVAMHGGAAAVADA